MCQIANGPVVIGTDVNVITPHGGEAPPGIIEVEYTDSYNFQSQRINLKVVGKPGSEYRIYFEEKSSFTSNTTVNYYNFTTGSFQTAATFGESTIGSSGRGHHSISLPSTLADKRFDIVIQGLGTTTLGANVPKAAGNAVIKQYGVKRLTIKPFTSTASNYGAIPTATIIRPTRYNDYSGSYNASEGFTTKGGNNNKSSNVITVNKKRHNLREGYILMAGFSGSTIPADTIITAVNKTKITLNNAVTIPNNTNLRFEEKSGSLERFSLTIPAASGKMFRDKTLTRSIIKSSITSLGDLTKTVKGNQAGTQIDINETTADFSTPYTNWQCEAVRGVVVGLKNVVDADTIEFAEAVTVTDGSKLVFTKVEDDETSELYNELGGSNEGNVRIRSLQARSEGNNLILEGYISVSQLNSSDALFIDLDQLTNIG